MSRTFGANNSRSTGGNGEFSLSVEENDIGVLQPPPCPSSLFMWTWELNLKESIPNMVAGVPSWEPLAVVEVILCDIRLSSSRSEW